MKLFSGISKHTIGSLISLYCNIDYWGQQDKGRGRNTKNQMELLRSRITSISQAAKMMEEFKGHEEDTDGTPWTITALHRFMTDIMDDCDGAAVLGVGLFNCAGHKADLWHLRGDRGHAVAVTRNGKYMGTNSTLYEFKNPEQWKDELLNECGDSKYEYMFK